MSKKIYQNSESRRTDLCLFFDEIEPYANEQKISLHQLFEYSRENKEDWYQCLSRLWHDNCGKEVLKSAFREKGKGYWKG